jgi:hypothetical protein
MKIKIKKMGSFFKIDKNDFIINPASSEKVLV